MEEEKTKKKKPKGCAIGCMVALGIVVLLFVIGLVGGGSSSTETQQEDTTQSNNNQAQLDDYEISRLARQSEEFYIQSAQIMAGVGNNGIESTMHSLSDLNEQIKEEMNKIPADTSEQSLQTIRQLLQAESDLVLAGYATLATGDTQEGGPVIQQYTDQIDSLIPQVRQYQ